MELTIFKRYLTRFLKENDIVRYKKRIIEYLSQEPQFDKSAYCHPFSRIQWGEEGGFEFWLLKQIAWLDYLIYVISDGELINEFEKQNKCTRFIFVKYIKLYTNSMWGINKSEEVEKAYVRLFEKTSRLI